VEDGTRQEETMVRLLGVLLLVAVLFRGPRILLAGLFLLGFAGWLVGMFLRKST
jgi:hypothetical protein